MNIETENDVVEWARIIVESKGEKYISLPKPALYVIAKWVVSKTTLPSAIATESKAPAPSERGNVGTYDPLGIPGSVTTGEPLAPKTYPSDDTYGPGDIPGMLETFMGDTPIPSIAIDAPEASQPPTTTGEELDPSTDENASPTEESPLLGEMPQSTSEERRLTRQQRLVKEGKDAQEAFDAFLEWSKVCNKQNFVIDFSNGMKSTAAAFAWWLLGTDSEMEETNGL